MNVAIFRCSVCNKETQEPGTGFSFRDCPECVAERKLRRFQRLCPPLYANSDPSRLPPEFKSVQEWTYGPQGLLVLGETGCGKTRSVWMLLRRLMLDPAVDYRVVFFDGVSFGQMLNRKFRREEAEDWLDSLASVDIVFFDDLGKLKLTERAEAELFGVIERRCANMKPILATTNDTGASIAARMTDNRGAAFVRRLREFCRIVQFRGARETRADFTATQP